MFLRSSGKAFTKYRTLLIIVWVLLATGLASLVPNFLSQLGGVSFTIYGSHTQQTEALVRQQFPSLPSEQDLVVVHSDTLIASDSAYRSVVAQAMQSLQGQPYVTSIISPYGLGSAQQVSADGHTALIIVGLKGADTELQKNAAKLENALPRSHSNIQTYLTGISSLNAAVNKQETSDILKADAIGLPVAFIVLLLAFGSIVAAGLPLLFGDIGIIVSFGLLAVLSRFMTFDIFEESAVTMVGLALGIDYSLMMVTRFREELASGKASLDATRRTLQTAGRAVLFSGITVIIADSGLLLVRAAFFRSLGVALMVTVGVMVVLCLTLLPIILSLLGRRINKLTVLKSSSQARDVEQGFWSKWAHLIMRRPIIVALGTTLILLMVAWPARSLHLGFNLGTDALGSQPSAQGLRLAERAFTPGVISPIQIVVTQKDGPLTGSDLAVLATVQNKLMQDGRIKSTASLTQSLDAITGRHDSASLARAAKNPLFASQLNVENGSNMTVMTVVPRVAVDSVQAMQLLDTIKNDIIPSATKGSNLQFGFTGMTVNIVDLNQEVTRSMPIVLTFVLGLSFVLLVITFRSLALPLKAILMNLLALGATFGMITVVFQNGSGAQLFNFTSPGYIQNYLPLLTFVILFGLSMDYEVFLLSRIQEEWRETHNNTLAVARGVEHTARVISFAAAIMIVVFSSFLITHILEIKQLGFALAAAVIIDATLIRLLLVPATMKILGKWNWWAPAWIRKRGR